MSFLSHFADQKKVRVEHQNAQPLFQYKHQPYCSQVALQQSLLPLQVDEEYYKE